MNKNVAVIFAAVCGLAMVSCDTPKDQRPGEKVSVSTVPAGTRNTNNIDNAIQAQPAQHHQEVIPNHDPGANTIQPGDTVAADETTTPAGAVNR